MSKKEFTVTNSEFNDWMREDARRQWKMVGILTGSIVLATIIAQILLRLLVCA